MRGPAEPDVTGPEMPTAEHGARLLRQRPRLAWTEGGVARSLDVTQRTVVGSAGGAGLIVADRTISRLHAELEPRADGLWVRDLGSKNGTYIEEIRVERGRVPPKGRLRVGGVTFAVDYGGPEPVELFGAARFGPLVGGSTAMRELFALLARFASSEAPVLVLGETGTGKELVARAIHDASPRARGPFVVVDCAALPDNLIEAELFGHAKGAFTGAVSAREGALEAAAGGTVFLDEIGELPIGAQPKLLRALESKQIRRVGETSYRTIDVRFVSATHRDLRRMVNVGAFREDLYFRVAVLTATIPALRERIDDLPMLVEHFVRAAPSAGDEAMLAPDVMSALARMPWLGNVRELRSAVERMRALGPASVLPSADDAGSEKSGPAARPASAAPPASTAEPASAPDDREHVAGDAALPSLDGAYRDTQRAWVEAFERAYFARLLERHERRIPEVAAAAGVDRTYVYRMIRRHRL